MRLLCVDDEAGIREGLAALLRLRGHEVRTAGDCATAIALLQSQSFDLVFTDWRLPDGIGALLFAHGDAPIVAISGFPEEVTSSPRLLAVMPKPLAPERLFELLAEREAALAAAAPVQGPVELPRDVRAALEHALQLLAKGSTAEVVDDGVFLTLRAPWPGDFRAAAFEALGGDLRVLQRPTGPHLELRWCRDGRPDVGMRVVAAGAGWLEQCDFAVDFAHATDLAAIGDLGALLDRVSAHRRAGHAVWFLNVPDTLRAAAAAIGRAGELPLPPRIGPHLPGVLLELWR